MKKMIAVLMVIIVCLGISLCACSENGNTKSSSDNQEVVTKSESGLVVKGIIGKEKE